MDNTLTEWHSIRPWRPALSLSVREITSVSVTFILSSPFNGSDTANPEPSLASLGLSSSDDDDQNPDNSSIDTHQSQIVSDVLAKGLSVKVNGMPWQRVLMRMDEEADEAVIIMFGLMPGRPYDVELGILPGESSIRGQITTDVEVHSDPPIPDSVSDETAAHASSSPTNAVTQSAAPPLVNGTGHTSHSNSLSPSASTCALTLEDRRLQLTHALNVLTAEHSSLTASLKTARRESQKADAALRAEIDTLKRASDRHASTEHRARQKVLALQEAVKQTLAATKEIESSITDIEAALPGLEQRRVVIEKEWTRIKAEAEVVRKQRKELEQKEKRRVEGLQAELAVMANRLEKLNGKREKLEGEGGAIPELEERLRKLEEERERVERDPYGYEGDAGELEDGLRCRGESSSRDDSPEADGRGHPHQHASGTRTHTCIFTLTIIHIHRSRPKACCASRTDSATTALASVLSPLNAGPGVIHLHHNKSYPGRVPVRPHGSGSGSSSASSSVAPSTPAAPPGIAPPSLSGSHLSSRAPPFEPSGLIVRVPPQQQPTDVVGQIKQSDLNPGCNPFSPRSSAAQTVPSTGTP
ncbi:hypothetical protein A0H81_02536 [Grifola frondosa]|uniref:Uncharacterized protein n=1 Tax=Grifola frondosa TaxID=5627 RepID=A0A1C7MN32_GRIFR|nr:hypothetical protein A0H81_02536 [Grifola frondosa]